VGFKAVGFKVGNRSTILGGKWEHVKIDVGIRWGKGGGRQKRVEKE
jgi:hypothetical protein